MDFDAIQKMCQICKSHKIKMEDIKSIQIELLKQKKYSLVITLPKRLTVQETI